MKKLSVLKIIAIIMLLFALGENPYSYYEILRWVIAGISAYLAFIAHEQKNISWTWIMAIVAILFNPIVPFHFARETWAVLDIITAIVIFVSIFKIKTLPQK